MKPWEKYQQQESGPWEKYAAAPVRPTVNPAAASPEVVTPLGTIKGEMGGALAFDPAAALISAGDLFSKLQRGYIEAREAPAAWITGRPSELLQRVRASREFAKQPMKELEEVHPGSAMIGKIAPMAVIPPAALPVLAATEEGSAGDRALGAGAAVAGNALVKFLGKSFADAPQRLAKEQSANKVRDELIAEARARGFSFPPSASGNPGMFTRTLEGLSGKAKTEQAATLKNQPLSDDLIREEFRLSKDAALTDDAMQAVISKAYREGYKPITDMVIVAPDKKLGAGLKNLLPDNMGGAVKNPASAEVRDLVGGIMAREEWTGAELVSDIRMLREMARANFNSAKREGGNMAKTELGHAQSRAAQLLEDLADRNRFVLTGKTGTADGLREARATIAKAHDVKDALVNGSIDVASLKAGPELTGNLKLLADLAADPALRKSVSLPVAGAGNPITAADALVAAISGSVGGPMAAVGLPAARVASRHALLSSPYQRMFGAPNYAPGRIPQAMVPLLQTRYAPALTGMFAYDLTR